MKILACVFAEIDFDGRVQRASEALAEIGDVTVLSIDSGRGYRSEKFKSTVVKRPAMIRSQIVMHLKMWLRLWLLVLRERPDFVHAHDVFMAFPGWIAARISGAKLVYDAHEVVIPEPDFKLGLRDRIWYWLEFPALKRADLVICANEERGDVMVDHYRLRNRPLVVQNIPPMPKHSETGGEGLPELRKETESERLIIYQGDVDVRRGILRFMDAFEFLPAQYRLIIIGGGPSFGELCARSSDEKFGGRVLMLSKIPRDQLASVLRQCDVGIVTYSYYGIDSLLCASNKVYEYAQAGLPMVLTDQVPLRRAVEQFKIGRLAGRHDSAQQIAAAIRYVAENRDEFVRNARAFAAANRWETEAGHLRNGVSSLVSPSLQS